MILHRGGGPVLSSHHMERFDVIGRVVHLIDRSLMLNSRAVQGTE